MFVMLSAGVLSPALLRQGSDVGSWAEVLECLDVVEQQGFLQNEEMRQLRMLCLERDDRLGILHTCYAKRTKWAKETKNLKNLKLYASRLRELLEIVN